MLLYFKLLTCQKLTTINVENPFLLESREFKFGCLIIIRGKEEEEEFLEASRGQSSPN